MIIGLTGQMGSGKDTVADYLAERYGFNKVGFADQLKKAIAELFGFSVETVERYKEEGVSVYFARPKEWPVVALNLPISMRTILQRMGTEVGRNMFGSDVWVEMLINSIDMTKDYAVKDVRFLNEAYAIVDCGGVIWRVTRPGHDGDSHASEMEMNEIVPLHTLHNDGTKAELYLEVDRIMRLHGR